MSNRRLLITALAAYGLFLAVVLLAPSSSEQSASVARFADLARSLGVPARFLTQARAEFVCNAFILMPLSALGSLLWIRTTWRDWTAYTFVIASAVEAAQGLLLPARTATFTDIVANTLGGLGGAAAIAVGRELSRRRTAAGTPRTSRD